VEGGVRISVLALGALPPDPRRIFGKMKGMRERIREDLR